LKSRAGSSTRLGSQRSERCVGRGEAGQRPASTADVGSFAVAARWRPKNPAGECSAACELTRRFSGMDFAEISSLKDQLS
jgi:hypothetical protein